MPSSERLLSVVVPVYNEARGITSFHHALSTVLSKLNLNYELIYCDDGSIDETTQKIAKLCASNSKVKLVVLSRNFGKEAALAAGIAQARGQAVLTLDGDGQHPAELIPEFVEKWQSGADVVIGVRTKSSGESFYARLASKFFYKLFNALGKQKLVPNSTDFRLIDQRVAKAFLDLHESNRITRGLIDWLGFKRTYVEFSARQREHGTATYSHKQLMSLATNSLVSMSPMPLYLFGYLGLLITVGAFLLGTTVIIEQLILSDPWHWRFTGTAMLAILILFLVGILLIAQGIVSLYIVHIHNQVKRRPLYVVDDKASKGLDA